jgi:hypothetical protein
LYYEIEYSIEVPELIREKGYELGLQDIAKDLAN